MSSAHDRPEGLDPDPEEMRRLGYRAVDLMVDWLARLGDAPVARMPQADVLEPLVAEPLPEEGLPVEAGMERFTRDFLPYATLVNHPRFFAFIPCPGSYIGALGDFLGTATNLFTSSWLGGAVATQLEAQVLDWLRQAVRLPPGFDGVLTSGGSLANLSALAAARAHRSRERGVLYASSATHYSVTKAARILGFTDAEIRILPVDDSGRMSPDTVRAAILADRDAGRDPLVLCATLGATTTGAIDPLGPLADVASELDVWFHVDGAYGAAARLLPELDAATEGLSRADSITLDPHKWLYSPFESGCFLTRHVSALEAAFAADGEYMQDIPRDEINLYRRGPELTRGNRALKLWLLIRSVGTKALADAIRKDIALCSLAHELLAADPRFEIVTEPRLSIFCFAVRGPESAARTEALMAAILADGYLMLSSSRVHGRYVLRFCVLNHRTTAADIRSSVDRIGSLLDQLSNESP